MGNALFKTVVSATGLPETSVSRELEGLLGQAGISSSEMTLEDLRQVLADYLQDVLLELKEELR